MGSDKTQIGARVDDDLWARFKQYVESKHGRTRGVLSKEVEDALDAYISGQYPTDRLSRIENDVATIKASIAEADGGEVIPEPPASPSRGDAHTHHTPESNISSTGEEVDVDVDDPDEPGRKAPKADKVEWLFDEMATGPGIVVNPKAIEKKIARTWGFGDRATNDLIDLLYERFEGLPVRLDDGRPWEVALGTSEAAREEAIGEWCNGEEYQFVTPDKVPSVAQFLH